MSVEGMWAIYFGDVGSPRPVENSGVIVLETGRLFGGDSFVAYLGSYDVDGTRIVARARTWSYNPAYPLVRNAFGREGIVDEITCFEGVLASDGVASGRVWEEKEPSKALPAQLRRIADLP